MSETMRRAKRTTEEIPRPMRDLILQLPLLNVTPSLEIDYPAADAALLAQVAHTAETAMHVVQLELSAVGQLLVRAAPVVEAGEISGDSIEALGWLMSELGDFSATAFALASVCRRFTSDYAPYQSRHVPGRALKTFADGRPWPFHRRVADIRKTAVFGTHPFQRHNLRAAFIFAKQFHKTTVSETGFVLAIGTSTKESNNEKCRSPA